MTEPASPACSAHEADDAYMGYATKAEIAAFLKEFETADTDSIRKMLPRMRNDLLYEQLSARLRAIEGLDQAPGAASR